MALLVSKAVDADVSERTGAVGLMLVTSAKKWSRQDHTRLRQVCQPMFSVQGRRHGGSKGPW